MYAAKRYISKYTTTVRLLHIKKGKRFLSLYVMFEVFEKYLLAACKLSPDDLASIREAGTFKNLRKWQSVLHDGETWRSICFITSGCLRLYRFDDNGTDHTVRFGIENWWIG